MTNISLEALKGKTIGEIIELSKQAQDLPKGFKFTYQSPQIQSTELSVGSQGVKSLGVGVGDKTEDTKTQTAEELLEEINMEDKS